MVAVYTHIKCYPEGYLVKLNRIDSRKIFVLLKNMQLKKESTLKRNSVNQRFHSLCFYHLWLYASIFEGTKFIYWCLATNETFIWLSNLKGGIWICTRSYIVQIIRAEVFWPHFSATSWSVTDSWVSTQSVEIHEGFGTTYEHIYACSDASMVSICNSMGGLWIRWCGSGRFWW